MWGLCRRSGLLHQHFGGFAALALDVEAILGVGNANTVEVEEFSGSIAAVSLDTLDAGLGFQIG